MLPKPDKISDAVLVTHMGCMDGSGCAILFLAAGGKKENIVYVSAGGVERFVRENKLIQSDKFLIFADVGFTVNGLRYADELEKRGNCVLLDHHATSSHLSDRSWCRIRMGACGTELFRKYLIEIHDIPVASKFHENHWANFSQCIDDYDRWQLKIGWSSMLAELAVFYGQDEFVKRYSDPWRFGRSGCPFDTFDMQLFDLLDANVIRGAERAAKNLIVRDVTYFDRTIKVGYVMSGNLNTSKLLDEVLKRRMDLDVVCQVMFDGNKVSMRSRADGPDVSKLAMQYKGGGHVHAAGHPISNTFIKQILEEIHS